jgi:hypothetical protein
MKRVTFNGDNFNEVVNFCTNSKVKNLKSFEFKVRDNGSKFILLKTNSNEYEIDLLDLILMKRNKLSYIKCLRSFQDVQKRIETNDWEGFVIEPERPIL